MRVSPSFVVWPVTLLYRLLAASWRLTVYNQEPLLALIGEKRSAVVCLWHDEIFPLFLVKKDMPVLALVSSSRDGDYLAGVYKNLGVDNVRGSSSRGGFRALYAMRKILREKTYCAGFAVDGPRGPRHKAKGGAIYLALQSGAPIVPLRMYSKRVYRFKSWDRFQMPLPFTHVTAVFGDPYMPNANPKDSDSMQAACLELEQILNELQPTRVVS